MALADLAVNFKLTGARDAQSQVDRLGGSFSKLSGTIDRASGMVKSSISTMMGMLSAGAIERAVSSVGRGMQSLAAMPNELVKARMEISKSRSELLHAGMDVYDVDEIERRGRKFTNEFAGITNNAYLQAFYEMQSSIPEATMKTKQKMAETALLTASVTSATNEDMAKLFAKAVHSLRAVGQSEDEIIQRMQAFGGKIKQAVDVGVFRGPDMLESLKETIPVWIQKGATDAEMVGLNTFLMTQGFNASTSGVFSREMAQRMPKAIAAAELARRTLLKTGSEEAARQSIEGRGQEKLRELYAVQKELDKTGIFNSGPIKMLEKYKESMEQLPKVLAEKLRLKYTHEHLDPGLLAIFGGWDNFMRMMKEVEKGNFSSVLDAMAAKSKEFAQSAGLMNQRIDNLKKTMGQGFEPLVGPFREYISNSVKEMQEAIEKNLPQIKGYFRGLNQGIKEALGINPLDSWIKSFNDLFSEQSGLSMFMKGESKGKEIGTAIKPWVDAFKKLGSSLDSVAASFQRFKATFKDVIDLVSGEGKAIERIQNFALSGAQQLGQEFKPYGYLKDQMYRWMPKEGETDEQYRARVIEQRKQDAAGVSASQSLHNLSPVDLIRYIGEQLGLLKEKQPPQPQMPSNIGLSGTLRIEGNTATINANGKPNTANAMGK